MPDFLLIDCDKEIEKVVLEQGYSFDTATFGSNYIIPDGVTKVKMDYVMPEKLYDYYTYIIDLKQKDSVIAQNYTDENCEYIEYSEFRMKRLTVVQLYAKRVWRVLFLKRNALNCYG